MNMFDTLFAKATSGGGNGNVAEVTIFTTVNGETVEMEMGALDVRIGTGRTLITHSSTVFYISIPNEEFAILSNFEAYMDGDSYWVDLNVQPTSVPLTGDIALVNGDIVISGSGSITFPMTATEVA